MKYVLNPYNLVAAQSTFDSITSNPVGISYMDNIGMQMVWTGSITGTITIQGSLDYSPTSPPRAGTWDDLTFDPAIDQPAGSAGGFLINLNQVPFPWVRVTWVPTVAKVRASKVIQDLTYTAVAYGTVGNSITVRYLDPGANNQPLSVSVSSSAITVNLATNGGGTITSTASQILAAIQASAPASALVTVAVSGTGSNVQTAVGATALTGGAGEDGTLDVWVCGKMV